MTALVGATQVLEAHILTCLTQSIQQLILIGDHEQLRPKTEWELTVESGKGLDLDRSLFERMVIDRTVPVCTLAVQRRMRPCIAELVRATLYPRLRDDAATAAYPPVRGVQHPLFFVDHQHLDSIAANDATLEETRSFANPHEAELVAYLARYLLQQAAYAPSDITILTPYLGQLRLLRDKLGDVLNDVAIEVSAADEQDLRRYLDLVPSAAAAAPNRTDVKGRGAGCSKSSVRVRVATIDKYIRVFVCPANDDTRG